MEVIIQQIGDELVLILPKDLLADQKIDLEHKFEIAFGNRKIILTPIAKKFTLNELVDQCDISASEVLNEDIQDWENSPPVGNEKIRLSFSFRN